MFKKFEALPDEMKNSSVKAYYDTLRLRRVSMVLKRLFDFGLSLMMILILSPVFMVVAIFIRVEGSPIIFRQTRYTTYMKPFKIYKFRTMRDSDLNIKVTVKDDPRITSVGRILRKLKLDELPQLFNILKGDMSFVGTRPEVKDYIDCYTDEMYATFLMPAGLTSLASVKYRNESEELGDLDNSEEIYVKEILPIKMSYNLAYLKEFGLIEDLKIVILTGVKVFL